jgi:hypothetical protein
MARVFHGGSIAFWVNMIDEIFKGISNCQSLETDKPSTGILVVSVGPRENPSATVVHKSGVIYIEAIAVGVAEFQALEMDPSFP